MQAQERRTALQRGADLGSARSLIYNHALHSCTGPETKGPLDLSALSVKVDCPNSEILGPGSSIPNMAEEGAEKKVRHWTGWIFSLSIVFASVR